MSTKTHKYQPGGSKKKILNTVEPVWSDRPSIFVWKLSCL